MSTDRAELPHLSSMGRGFEVLRALGDLSRRGVASTVQAVARELDRDRSQISRTLSVLAERGLVVRDTERAYTLSWNWYATAQELTDQRLQTAGTSTLDDLAAELGQPCFLGVLRGDSTVTLLESIPEESRMIGSWRGRAYPAFCSDAGRAVLWDASEEEIRAVFAGTDFRSPGPNAPASIDDFITRWHQDRSRGYSIVDQEAEPGLYSVAAPVWDFRGEVVAAIQVVGERTILHPRTAECGAAAGRAATELSRQLGAPSADQTSSDAALSR